MTKLPFKKKLENSFTDLEIAFLEGIAETFGEYGQQCAYLEDVVEYMETTNKTARGIVSSLIKKGIILECLPEYGGEINLTEKGADLLGIEYDF